MLTVFREEMQQSKMKAPGSPVASWGVLCSMPQWAPYIQTLGSLVPFASRCSGVRYLKGFLCQEALLVST